MLLCNVNSRAEYISASPDALPLWMRSSAPKHGKLMLSDTAHHLIIQIHSIYNLSSIIHWFLSDQQMPCSRWPMREKKHYCMRLLIGLVSRQSECYFVSKLHNDQNYETGLKLISPLDQPLDIAVKSQMVQYKAATLTTATTSSVIRLKIKAFHLYYISWSFFFSFF